jgi:site-specific DNA-methyltransferase (adenine-specific)
MDALEFLRGLPGASADAVITDPPYFKVKPVWWDHQWDDRGSFLCWIYELALEWQRVLKPNGSLYVFASPQMAARVEVEIGKLFNVLNRITWQKPKFSTKAEMFDKDTMRAFFPASEAIIFAEQRIADGDYQNALIDENSSYWTACETAKRSIIGDYLEEEFKRANISRREIAALFPSKTGNLTGCVSNWIIGYNIPTRDQYETIRQYLNNHHNNGSSDYLRREYEDLRREYEDLRREYEDLRREYEDLRREYEDLRREYEDLRRPFNMTEFDQYTDVWAFKTVQAYEGKHPTEKPLTLMKHIISASTKPGAIILDPFVGSGTTCDAARQLGRHYTGCDLDPHWAEYAQRRLAQSYTPDMFDTLPPADDPKPEQLTLIK